MKLFTVFSVLVVVLMLAHFGESCGPVYPVPTIHPRRLHFPNTTRNETAGSRIIQPHQNDSVLSKIAKDGALRGQKECQKLFENRATPWNCPEEMYKKLPMYSDKTFPYATRETGFIHAISAAAITYELTHRCTQGKIPGCGCSKVPRPKGFTRSRDVWIKWLPCGDNIEFGLNESKRFTDDLEKENDAVRAVNLHNNQVGREVVRTSARVACTCLGFNMTCGYRACWMAMAPFRVILAKLMKKYDYSEKVWLVDSKLRARNYHPSIRKTITFNLVYLDSSPGRCEGNDTLGHPGMLGHSCKSDSSKDKCELFTVFCKWCELRVKVVEHTKQVKCRCKFECEVCTEKYSVMTCSTLIKKFYQS